MITIDDFKKIDIQVGTILSAEEIEGAHKLLKLMVDIGEETPRQIVSGIKEYFEDISVLPSRQILIVANLEPRSLMGLESQGMILAIKDRDALSLLTVDRDTKNGLRVS